MLGLRQLLLSDLSGFIAQNYVVMSNQFTGTTCTSYTYAALARVARLAAC